MKLGLILHLYQPPTQQESVFRQIVRDCYVPLLKFIKNKKNQHFTLNIPLSLLEQMDKYGYKEWIDDLKFLYDNERIEVLGSAAYHPLLTKLPEEIVNSQVVLNEYSLGYYLGSHRGFEGEPSLMLRDIVGFFPPELAINTELVRIINDLGYKWILADEISFSESDVQSDSYFKIDNLDITVVKRDKILSDLISFKRDLDISDIKEYISKLKTESVIVALDGEYFGHHYNYGLEILEMLTELDVQIMKVSDLVPLSMPRKTEYFFESTWGATREDLNQNNPYPYWESPDNKIQKLLWELDKILIGTYVPSNDNHNNAEVVIYPIWNTDNISPLLETDIINSVRVDIMLQRMLHSDKYWWVSKKKIGDTSLFNPGMVNSYLSLVNRYLEVLKENNYKDISKFQDKVESLISEIHDLMLS